MDETLGQSLATTEEANAAQAGTGFAPFGRDALGRPKTFWNSSLLQWIVSLGVFLLLWEAIFWSGLVPPRILPPPHYLLREIERQPNFWELAYIKRRGNFFNLPTTVYISMRRVTLGLLSAFVIGVLTGLLVTYVSLVRRFLQPIIRMLAPISPIAWMPLAMFFLGVGEEAIVFVIFISLFFTLTLTTSLSIQNIDKVIIDAAKVLGASRRQIMFQVTIPAILPDLFLSLRMNFYGAWMSLLVAEMIGAETGLGQMVMAGRGVFNMQLVILGMGFIAVFGMLSETILRLIQRRVLWWQREAEL
jgi:NitT/TauT family transport system permease protein